MYSRKSGAVFGTRRPTNQQQQMVAPNRVLQAAIRTSLPAQFGRALTGRQKK